ncbi:MAG TPA: hypothetical protein V6C65_29165, partial [Allocoleopsis sp.]
AATTNSSAGFVQAQFFDWFTPLKAIVLSLSQFSLSIFSLSIFKKPRAHSGKLLPGKSSASKRK